jgi:DNA recombination protein RmuC
MVIVTAGFAGGVGFIVGRGRAAVAEERSRHWREEAERLHRGRETAEEKVAAERKAAVEEACASRDEVIDRVRAEREDLSNQLEKLHGDVRDETAKRARAEADLAVQQAQREADLAAARARYSEQIELLTSTRETITQEVAQLGMQMFEDAGGKLLKQATDVFDQRTEAAGRELDLRRQGVDELIKPLAGQLATLTEYVQAVEKDHVGAFAALREQMTQMATITEQLTTQVRLSRDETGRLVTALRRPNVRGRWGEQQLRNVVDAAGMLNKVDFVEQPVLTTGDTTQRPDMIVRVGGGMEIVVDAKTPFNAFLDAHDARDDDEREKLMAAHVKYMRRHIEQLAKKEYWDLPDDSPRFVVMFVPSEVFLYAALEQDPELWSFAAARNVVPATPSSLLVLLKSVAVVLRHEAMVETAKTAAAKCSEITDVLRILAKNLTDLGKKLNITVGAFNTTIGTMEGEVLPRAREIDNLQEKAAPPIPELARVDRAVRMLALPEAPPVSDDATAALIPQN